MLPLCFPTAAAQVADRTTTVAAACHFATKFETCLAPRRSPPQRHRSPSSVHPDEIVSVQPRSTAPPWNAHFVAPPQLQATRPRFDPTSPTNNSNRITESDVPVRDQRAIKVARTADTTVAQVVRPRVAPAPARAAKPQNTATVLSSGIGLREVITPTKCPRATQSRNLSSVLKPANTMSGSEPQATFRKHELNITRRQSASKTKNHGGVSVFSHPWENARENKAQTHVETPPSHSASRA